MKTIKIGETVLKMKAYPFPKRGNGAADFTLNVNGVALPASEVRKTGGGKFPTYIYLMLDGKSFYVAADLPSGAAVTVSEEVVAAPKVEAPKVVAAPKLTKAERKAAKAAAKAAKA